MGCARPHLLVLILVCGVLFPFAGLAQDSRGPPASSRGFRLEQNYPNPVNPETWIPFTLEDRLFANGDSTRVTIRIFNILRETVAVPVALDHPRGREPKVEGLVYTQSGRYVAYWDGRNSDGRRAPSGVYYYQILVNDTASAFRKLTVLSPRRRGNIIPWFGSTRDRPD